MAKFAARKSWQQAQELAALLDKNGTRRPRKEFQRLARPIVGNYNQRWLQTEYNMAVRTCRSAAQWQGWEAQKGLYPNLKYLASRAATPRDDHKPYYGITLPIDHEFWNAHLPPSAWNCQCSVEQTDDDATLPPAATAKSRPKPGLDNNPGKTGEVFNLETGPYKIDDADLAAQIDKEAHQATVQVERERVKLLAKDRLTNKTISHPDLPFPIQFTNKGIKKTVSQTHKHLLEVIGLMANGIEEALETADYVGFKPDYKNKSSIKGYHYLKIDIAGESSFVNLRHDNQNNITLYAILDHMHP